MNSVKKTRDGLFGSGKFYKNALSIAVPIMLQQLIQSMVSLVDNFMVSGLGDVAMSGVNVAGQIIFVFMVYVNTICMAGGIFMTQYFGADDKNGMGQADMTEHKFYIRKDSTFKKRMTKNHQGNYEFETGVIWKK